MTIYIDSNYRCHTSNPDGTFRKIETDEFEGKCDSFISGYRFVPEDESWKREDGEVFEGEMRSPWMNFDELQAGQLAYELAECETLINELYAEVTAE